jgi:hypothetical protein
MVSHAGFNFVAKYLITVVSHTNTNLTIAAIQEQREVHPRGSPCCHPQQIEQKHSTASDLSKRSNTH